MLTNLWPLIHGPGSSGGGGSSPSAVVNNSSHSSSATSGGTAQASAAFYSSGGFVGVGNLLNSPSSYAWKGAGLGVDYDIWFETSGGDLPTSGDALGAWLSLSSSRVQEMANSVAGTTKSGTLLVKIRDAATLVELDTGTISLSATVGASGGGGGGYDPGDGGGGGDGGLPPDWPGGQEQN